MRLEDYFDFLSPTDIRIKGSRIGIETILIEHLENGKTPEQIQREYPTLTIEEVYATILLYHHDREKVGIYLQEYDEYCKRARREFEKNPPPGIERLRKLAAALEIRREAWKEEGRVSADSSR